MNLIAAAATLSTEECEMKWISAMMQDEDNTVEKS